MLDNNEMNKNINNDLENWTTDIDLSGDENLSSDTNTDSLLDDDLLTEWEWVVSLQELRKKEWWKNLKTKILWIASIIMFVIFIWVYGVYYFLELSLSDERVEWYDKDYMEFVWKNILSSEDTYSVLDWWSSDYNSRTKWMQSYIMNKWVFFYQKKESVKDFVSKEKNKFSKLIRETNNIKQSIVKYKFLPKDLTGVVKNIKLLPILLTLNSIKLYITDYIYIETGRFKTDILSKVENDNKNYSIINNACKWQLPSMIKTDILKLRELWVKTYLNDIVFNYMYVDPSRYMKTDTFADKNFIHNFSEQNESVITKRVSVLKKCGLSISKEELQSKYIMILADVYKKTNELFEDDVDLDTLPVDINLLSYEPEKQVLAFNVKISVREWESKVSVVKLATDIITLLRESRLIIWSTIWFDKLKVSKVVTRTVNWKKVYDTTNLVFKTSVQDDVNVEVTDVELNK